ncbi:uncharacterized protein [Triticum aestivum]|uniref:uncharacterized protein n=1 Tax=Triticum aestivum TaxID=4565 RepID=UPI001D01130A|nr:uncharacterized protein LOC123100320 [Triticum aestivum]XP_044378197.1 uncharacterized protein LOC123100320 [Triticum aestivum]
MRLLSAQTFLFSVPCASLVQKILLCQPLRRRLFSLSFLPYGPAVHAQPPPSVPLSCKPLSDFMLLHHSVGLKFENAAWTRLKSFTTVPSAPAPPSCPLTVTFFQFPLPISPVLCDLILHCLFGGNPRQFHSAVVTEDEFSCVVANRGVADLILSFGDLRRPGIDVRFSLPEQRSPAPPAATLVPAPMGAFRLHHRAATGRPRPSVKVRQLRHGLKFRSLILRRFNVEVVPHQYATPDPLKHSLLWISFFSAVAKPSACLVKLTLDHFFSGSSSFFVLHYQANIFLALVSSADVLNEIVQRSPVSPPGIALVLSKTLLAAKSASFSNFESIQLASLAVSDQHAALSPVNRSHSTTSILGCPPALPPPPPAACLLELFTHVESTGGVRELSVSTRADVNGETRSCHFPRPLSPVPAPPPSHAPLSGTNMQACATPPRTPSQSALNANVPPLLPSLDRPHTPTLSQTPVHGSEVVNPCGQPSTPYVPPTPRALKSSTPPSAAPLTRPELSPIAAASASVPSYRDALLSPRKVLDRPCRSAPAPRSRPNPPAILCRAHLSFPPRIRSRPLCFRCLAGDHLVQSCRDPVRCSRCGGSGHRNFHCSSNLPLAFQRLRLLSHPAMATPARVPSPKGCDDEPNVLWIGSHRLTLSKPLAHSPRSSSPVSEDGDSAPLSQRGNDSDAEGSVLPSDAASAVGCTARSATLWSSSASSPGRAHSTYPDIFVPSGLIHDVGHFCFVHLDTVMLEPYDLIHRAIELHANSPSYHFAATTGCAALIVFDTNADREATMAFFPADYAGVRVTLLRPEETDNRATTCYDRLVEIEAKNFPLELWHPQGANFVFGHFGVLCCVDQNTLVAGDFTAVRAFVRVESDNDTPDGCILRLPPAQVVDVKLRRVKTWAILEDTYVPLDDDLGGDNNRGPHVHGAWRWNCGHAGPCTGSHDHDHMSPPSPTAAPTPASRVSIL